MSRRNCNRELGEALRRATEELRRVAITHAHVHTDDVMANRPISESA
jgi:hypothetical protein